tara:strand:- start:1353 stop:1508 length:156 start_codon:yes stop_codon:yes gene_type:complete
MDAGIKQLIVIIIAITVASLIVVFLLGKIGTEGTITNVSSGLLESTKESLR